MSIDNEPEGFRCAAFGCPLLGSAAMTGDGRWLCCCHANRYVGANDLITHRLRTEWLDVVDMTLAIRRDDTGMGKSAAMRQAYRAMKAAGRGELLFNREHDGNTRAYLLRLERALIEAVSSIGEQKRIPLTVPTATVTGPTHAMTHYRENERNDTTEEHDA